MKVVAIDPYGCGCTECLTGEYVPLSSARSSQVKAMLKGKLDDHTGETFTKTVEYQSDGRKVTTVKSEHHGLSWRWEKYV